MPPRRSRPNLIRWGRVALLALLAWPTVVGAQDAATPTATGPGGWPVYGADLAGTRAAADTVLSAANVAQLQPAWQVEVGGPVSGTPTIADGVAYVGSYDGHLYALDLATGEGRWAYDTGAQVPEPNLGIDLGVSGSAAVEGGTVFVGDAGGTVHAVDAATSEARWRTEVDAQPAASIWSSPVPWQGRVYVGVASIAKELGFRGSVVALDAASGELLWQTFMVPEGADGAGVFAVPTVDPERGMVYVGTQNAYSPNPAPYGDPISLVALDAASGERRWAFNAPPGGGQTAPTEDVGLSASPNLFTVEIDGTARDLVGNGQKSGDYWALDRDSGEVVWQAKVSPAGFLGGMEGTSAVADGVVAVPATDWPAFEGPATGLISGLDAATGAQLWTSLRTAPVASPAAIAGDVVLQGGMDGLLRAYALADGTELWSADLGASVSGGIAVAGGTVVLGAATPEFAPFVRGGRTVQAFALGATPGTPAPGTPATATDGRG